MIKGGNAISKVLGISLETLLAEEKEEAASQSFVMLSTSGLSNQGTSKFAHFCRTSEC
jgi:hypothetical protein